MRRGSGCSPPTLRVSTPRSRPAHLTPPRCRSRTRCPRRGCRATRATTTRERANRRRGSAGLRTPRSTARARGSPSTRGQLLLSIRRPRTRPRQAGDIQADPLVDSLIGDSFESCQSSRYSGGPTPGSRRPQAALTTLTGVHETMRKYASYDFAGVLNARPDLELPWAVPRSPANRIVVLIRCSRPLHNSARSQTWTRPQIKGMC